MKLVHRLGFYFSGFAVGLILLIFFLSGKNTSCNYFPNNRVLSDIKQKPKKFTPKSLGFFKQKALDTAEINTYLDHSNIDFSSSKTDLQPCPVYQIESNIETKNFILTIKNCRDFAEVEAVHAAGKGSK